MIRIPDLPSVNRLLPWGLRLPSKLASSTHLDLAAFFQRFPLRSAQTALGTAQDGLPLVLDLTDARVGPLLVLGDPGCGKTGLLQMLLYSALQGGHIEALVISCQPQEFAHLAALPGLLGAYHPDDEDLPRQLYRHLAALDQPPTRSLPRDLPLLVVLDDLSFIHSTRFEVRTSLEAAFRRGPAVHIWPMASLSTSGALMLGRWTRYFRTRLVGRMSSAAARRLGLHPGLSATRNMETRQFSAYLGGRWLPFRVPLLPGAGLPPAAEGSVIGGGQV
jgi:hypothetical protein